MGESGYIVGGLLGGAVIAGALVLLQRKDAMTTRNTFAGLPVQPRDVNAQPPGTAPGESVSSGIQAGRTDDAGRLEAERRAAAQAAAQETARLEAERRAAAERAERINALSVKARQVENDQKEILGDIEAIQRDNSQLNGFVRLAYDELRNSPSFEGRVRECEKAVSDRCGWDFLGGCNRDNAPKCRTDPGLHDWSVPSQMWREANDPNNPNGGPARLARWKLESISPLEGRLARLEVQYQGHVQQLAGMGVTFESTRPEIHNR